MSSSSTDGGIAVNRDRVIPLQQHVTYSSEVLADDLTLSPGIGVVEQFIYAGLFGLLPFNQVFPPTTKLFLLLAANLSFLLSLPTRPFLFPSADRISARQAGNSGSAYLLSLTGGGSRLSSLRDRRQ